MQYVLGGLTSPEEIKAAFQQMYGNAVPPTWPLNKAMGIMMRDNAARFEFEVNRCRGLAFDATVEKEQTWSAPGSLPPSPLE